MDEENFGVLKWQTKKDLREWKWPVGRVAGRQRRRAVTLTCRMTRAFSMERSSDGNPWLFQMSCSLSEHRKERRSNSAGQQKKKNTSKRANFSISAFKRQKTKTISKVDKKHFLSLTLNALYQESQCTLSSSFYHHFCRCSFKLRCPDVPLSQLCSSGKWNSDKALFSWWVSCCSVSLAATRAGQFWALRVTAPHSAVRIEPSTTPDSVAFGPREPLTDRWWKPQPAWLS